MTSEIRTNTLKSRVGLGTVSFTNTGPIVSGIVTANSFSGPISGTTGTFSGNVDINGDLDVDGHTELDNVNIVGVTTHNGTTNLYGNGGASVVWGNTGYTGHLSFDGSNNAVIRAASGKALIFQTNHVNERLRIDSSGRLLIGTTTEGHGNADDLTIATTDHTGITLRSATNRNGSVFFSDGTSGADEYRGWIQYTHTSDYLTFGTAANERVRITSGGLVGIGTIPASGTTLDIDASGGGVLALRRNSVSTSNKITLSSDGTDGTLESTNKILFRAGGDQRVTIDSDGHLLVSTTRLSSQNGSIQAAGPILCKSFINAHTSNATVMEYNNGISRIRAYGGTAGSGILAFNTGGGGDSTDSEALRITSDGKFGFGTASLSENTIAEFSRDVGSGNLGASITVRNTSTNSVNNVAELRLKTNHGVARFYKYNTASTVIQSHSGGASHLLLYADGASNIRLHTNSLERLRITSDGNVGVNVTDPKSKLHLPVNADVRIGGQYGGTAQVQNEINYSSGYTGVHWMFESNQSVSWCFDGVMIVNGSGSSSYGSEVVKITIVYSREHGALNSGDTWRNGTSSYNFETLGHDQVGLNPSAGTLSVTEQTDPDGAGSTRSLLKLSWSASGQSVGVTSRLIGNLHWSAAATPGGVEIQDKDGNVKWNSHP